MKLGSTSIDSKPLIRNDTMMHSVRIDPLEPRLMMSTTPNDASYSREWGLAAVNAPAAWDNNTGSVAVTVAHIDTGIDYTHPDLFQNIWINQAEIPAKIKATLMDTDRDGVISFYDLNASANQGKTRDVNRNGYIDAADLLARARHGGWLDGVDAGRNGYVDDIIGWDFADNDNNPLDYDGHGTHTAGTIAATGNNKLGVTGVAWKSSLMALKIFDDYGDSATSRQIGAAIRYAADNGARVSNNSWGSSFASTSIYNAIAYAQNRGHIFVTAAGNDSSNVDSGWVGNYPGNFNLASIIAVAATTSSGSLASYSNYGKANVDIAAPGSSVLSTWLDGDYELVSGTSMSTPFVTGTIALMLAKNPRLTATQIKNRLINGADQSAALYNTNAAGGELNIDNALTGATGTRYTPSSSSSTGTPVYRRPRRGWWWFSTTRVEEGLF